MPGDEAVMGLAIVARQAFGFVRSIDLGVGVGPTIARLSWRANDRACVSYNRSDGRRCPT